MDAIKSWIADAFARENEALTKALQISLSDYSSASETLSSLPPPLPNAAKSDSSEPAARRFGVGLTGNPIPCLPSGKIAKKKSRASKRTLTTYINADPADFQRMVQEVTGIEFGEVGVPVDKRVRPEPDRTGMGWVGQAPGLLLDRTAVEVCDTVGPVVNGPAFEFEPFPCFPTLESWGM
ncbi:hypothetical protein KFK09_003218 [Dendrobium nobile]|uniref:VQ domain-containing protein n=1 Tax=Dendrobium nobile TaxID=94219 RepID=A0A8T3C9H1_DENNO|nr:hypothetical protein KFK09_003218 [Dendrobium nobile]